MKKIGIIFLSLFLIGCHEDDKIIDKTRQEYTRRVMLETDLGEEEIIETASPDDIVVDDYIVEDIPEVPATSPYIDSGLAVHKGRVNCTNILDCITIASKRKEEYDEIINDVLYLEVFNEKGFFIKYIFNSFDFDSNDKCLNYLNRVKDTFRNIIKDIKCEDSKLIIMPDYEGGSL